MIYVVVELIPARTEGNVDLATVSRCCIAVMMVLDVALVTQPRKLRGRDTISATSWRKSFRASDG
jgi:hypothetical protein